MQRLTKLSLRRNVEYNVQLLSINVHVINHFILDAAISKATAKGSVNLFGFKFEATAFQNLKREIDNSLKNNVSHDERPA